MREWKQKGIVRDSDDDEEALSESEQSHDGASTCALEPDRQTLQKNDTQQSDKTPTATNVSTIDSLNAGERWEVAPPVYTRKRTPSSSPHADGASARSGSTNAHPEVHSLEDENGMQILFPEGRRTSQGYNLSDASQDLDRVHVVGVTKPRVVSNERHPLNADLPSPVTPSNPVVRVDVPQENAQNHEIYTIVQDDGYRGSNRNLRHRNPIQLHPYLLENEAYRKSLRARGLRPVQVARTTNQDSGTLEDGRQNIQSSPSDVSFGDFSGNIEVQPLSSGASNVVSNSHKPEEDSDEIPKVEALIRQAKTGTLRLGSKRRKTEHHAAQTALQKQTRKDHERQSETSDIHGLPNDGNCIDPFAFDPSPPSSPPISLRWRGLKRKFKKPRALGEDSLPTPITSSELSAQQHHEDLPIDSSESDDVRRISRPLVKPQTGNTHTSIPDTAHKVQVVSLSDSESLGQSEPGDKGGYRRQQKRIKGVLPASWLRLDRQMNQSERYSPINISKRAQLPQQSPVKGVARRVVRVNTLEEDHARHYDSLSRSASPVPFNNDSGRDSDPPNEIDSAMNGSLQYDGDNVVEDNAVDPMLPRLVHDTRVRAKKGYKRQTKLGDIAKKNTEPTFRKPEGVGKSVPPPARSRRKSRNNTGVHRKQWVRRKAAPRLSILDAPEVVHPTGTPNFVKVAKRQVRRATHPIEQDPSLKSLSLHTQQDGAEIDSVLQDWRNGCIKPRKSNKLYKEPLQLPNPSSIEPNRNILVSGVNQPKSTKRLQKSPSKRKRQSKLEVFRQVHVGASGNPLTEISDNAQNTRHPEARDAPRRNSSIKERSGQLEQLQAEYFEQHPHQDFHYNLAHVGRQSGRTRSENNYDLHAPLQRFLNQGETNVKRSVEAQDFADRPNNDQTRSSDQVRARRSRKRRPQYIHQNQIEAHVPLSLDPGSDSRPVSDSSASVYSKRAQDPFAFTTNFTVDFGIGPLPVGVCFRAASFIGSGDLSRALDTCQRDLNTFAGYTQVICEEKFVRLGPWCEEASGHFQQCVQQIPSQRNSSTNIATNVSHVSDAKSLRSWIKYVTHYLSFSDSIDRQSFVADVVSSVDKVLGQLCWEEEQEGSSRKGTLQLLVFLLVLVAQVKKISAYPAVSRSCQDSADRLITRLARELSKVLFTKHNSELVEFHELPNIRQAREYGITDTSRHIEAIVVLYHVVKHVDVTNFSFWGTVGAVLSRRIPVEDGDAQELEHIWHEMFAILPLLEIDEFGVLKPGLRRNIGKALENDCSPAKELLAKTFSSYNTFNPSTSFSSYIRAILSRCHRLVYAWGWLRCEPLLSHVYGFFAKRSLHALPNEGGRGSAKFLESLDKELVPHVDNADHSYSIFLKLLATGLVQMQRIYPDKKVKNIAWRFVPNHGRAYQKDENLQQTDLDALRNHHDLLSVLYYASPAGMRPSLASLRNLVDFKCSHAEACRLNIKAWANLVRYQLSTVESTASVATFVAWFDEIVSGCVYQHRLARTEADAMTRNATSFFSWDVLERTVAKNQEAVEAILETIYSNLAGALKYATNVKAALGLFEGLCRTSVSQLCYSEDGLKSDRLLSTSVLAYLRYFEIFTKMQSENGLQTVSEDSQDYGDIDLDDETELLGGDQGSSIQHQICDEVRDMIKFVLDASVSCDNQTIELVMKTFVKSLTVSIKSNRRDWVEFLDPASSQSWESLSNNHRKLTPLFYAECLAHDVTLFERLDSYFLSSWMECLVERDALLGYQDRLTTEVLKAGRKHILLQDLNFASMSFHKQQNITLNDFRQQRILALSTLLANMGITYESISLIYRDQYCVQLRRLITDLLRRLMKCMRRNYEEIQATALPTDDYINFIQSVVQLLQQYTTSIERVDSFFLDPATFPQPLHDPQYHIGQLRSYSRKIGDEQTQKTLVIFFHHMVLDAVESDHLHVDIAGLLVEASGLDTTLDASKPSLVLFLLSTLFPAYIQVIAEDHQVLRTASSVLRASEAILNRLLTCLNLSVEAPLQIVLNAIHPIVETSLYSTQQLLSSISHRHYTSAGFSSLSCLLPIYKVLNAAFKFVNFAARQTQFANLAASGHKTLNLISRFAQVCNNFLIIHIFTTSQAPPVNIDLGQPESQSEQVGIQTFAYNELKSLLSRRQFASGDYIYDLDEDARVKKELGEVAQRLKNLLKHSGVDVKDVADVPGVGERERRAMRDFLGDILV